MAWASDERKNIELMNGEMRSVERIGTTTALPGNFNEDSLRQWLTAMVADQAYFRESPLVDA